MKLKLEIVVEGVQDANVHEIVKDVKEMLGEMEQDSESVIWRAELISAMRDDGSEVIV